MFVNNNYVMKITLNLLAVYENLFLVKLAISLENVFKFTQ